MAYSFDDFDTRAGQVRTIHKEAVEGCLEAGKEVAAAQATWRLRRAEAVEKAKAFHGATVAEAIGDGEKGVVEAEKVLTIRKAKDRAAVQLVKLAEADRAILLTMGSWSKSQEAAE